MLPEPKKNVPNTQLACLEENEYSWKHHNSHYNGKI